MIYLIVAFLSIYMIFNLYDGYYEAAIGKGIALIVIILLSLLFKKLGEKLRNDYPDMEKNTDKK